jgi:uroporphyrinogen decarboxylase
MTSYTHRERVIAALNHREPDRMPVDLMGHATMLLDETYERLRDFLGLSPIPPVRSGTSANYYDERILAHFDVDFRRLFLKTHPEAPLIHHPDGSYTDAWGICSKRSGVHVNVVGSPLTGASTVAEVEAFAWPNAQQLFTAQGLAAEARRQYEQTDYALVARNPLSYGLRERACMLMGMQEFMTALALQPAVADCIIGHLLDIYKDVYGMFLDAVGPYVQTVEVGDDLGSQQGLLISASMYRRFFKPAERELYDLIHAKAPGAKLIRHSDGAFFSLIPDLIEIGVDVLNPVQSSAKGMAAATLKSTFGQQLAFHGGIESIEGDVPTDALIAEVKNRIDVLGPGGGYVLASCNHMMDVRPENIIAMFETAHAYGRYR